MFCQSPECSTSHLTATGNRSSRFDWSNEPSFKTRTFQKCHHGRFPKLAVHAYAPCASSQLLRRDAYSKKEDRTFPMADSCEIHLPVAFAQVAVLKNCAAIKTTEGVWLPINQTQAHFSIKYIPCRAQAIRTRPKYCNVFVWHQSFNEDDR